MAEQAGNRTEFSIERETSSRHGSEIAERARNGPRPDGGKSGPSPLAPGEVDGFPDRLRRKYYVVLDAGRERDGDENKSVSARVYADAKGEYLAFKDTGARLTTRLDGADTARDMVAVAVHRGWDTIRVRGSSAFRREAWLEASARGLDVRGYEPSDIDRAALTKRAADLPARVGRDPAPGPERSEEDRTGAPSSTDADRAAPRAKQDRSGAPSTRQGSDASVDSGPGSGTGHGAGGLAERFRTLGRNEAVREPALAAAHSQLAVLARSLREVFPTDAQARSVVLDAARGRIAEHLEKGRTFRRAEIRVPEPARHPARNGEAVELGPLARAERARVRERGRDR